MKPGFTPSPIITPEGFTNLISHIQKEDSNLYDALIKGTLNVERAYQLIKNHEDRLINLEKSKKECLLLRTVDFLDVVSGTPTFIPFDNAAYEEYDNDDMHDYTTNPERITFNTPGFYTISAGVSWEAFAGLRILSIDYNVLNTSLVADVINNATADAHYQNVATNYKFSQRDWIAARVTQTSGIVRDVLAGTKASIFLRATMTERIWNPEDIPNRMVE